MECLEQSNCQNLSTQDQQVECTQTCLTENGFHLYDFYQRRGICYPDACSAAELLVVHSDVIPREIDLGFQQTFL